MTQNIRDSINKLTFSQQQQSGLQERTARSAIGEIDGRGLPSTSQSGNGSGGGGVPVKVTGKVSDSVYKVSVYGNGASSDPTDTNVDCTQLQIAAGQTIPNGSWTIAAVVNNMYFMQFPVFLGPPA